LRTAYDAAIVDGLPEGKLRAEQLGLEQLKDIWRRVSREPPPA
jgi:hypothetical protein